MSARAAQVPVMPNNNYPYTHTRITAHKLQLKMKKATHNLKNTDTYINTQMRQRRRRENKVNRTESEMPDNCKTRKCTNIAD